MISPQDFARQRHRCGGADLVAHRCAELEHLEPPPQQIDIVDRLRALIAPIDHARVERVGAVALAEPDILGPQRDPYRVARREPLQQRGFGALAAAQIDDPEVALARDQLPGDLVRGAGEIGDEDVGGAAIDRAWPPPPPPPSPPRPPPPRPPHPRPGLGIPRITPRRARGVSDAPPR